MNLSRTAFFAALALVAATSLTACQREGTDTAKPGSSAGGTSSMGTSGTGTSTDSSSMSGGAANPAASAASR